MRLDGQRLPDWFDPNDGRIALFYTAPHAFDIASQLSRTLLGCNPAWTVELPGEFLRRQIRQMTLKEALALPGKSFVKHSVSKAFPADVYDSVSLAQASVKLRPGALVHVAEIVAWTVEYRCFVLDGAVVTISPYRRLDQVIEGHGDLDAPIQEVEEAKQFAISVLQAPAVRCPPAFVLDVGYIADRGWAVVEFNECWASGIYACDPARVLDSLSRACVPSEKMTQDERAWDFEKHYLRACA